MMKLSRLNFVALFLCSGLLFSSCKKDKDSTSGKKAKITFSVSNAFNKAEGDDFSLSAGGALLTGKFVDWYVNGEKEVGTIVSVGNDFVNGGKNDAVVESVDGFNTGSVTIHSFNISGEPFTIKYKIEYNGNIIDEKTVEIKAGADVFYKDYTLN